MAKMPIVIIAAMAVAACAGTSTLDIVMEGDGTISVRPSELSPNEWIVTALPAAYIGYNYEKQEDRFNAALRMVRKQCSTATVVSERSFVKGRSLAGTPYHAYYITVRC